MRNYIEGVYFGDGVEKKIEEEVEEKGAIRNGSKEEVCSGI
jgi:hypothetical protein